MSPSHLLENILRHSSFPSTISPWQWKGKKEKFVSSGFSPCWGYFLWMNGDLGAGCLSWGQRPVWSIRVTSYASISSSSWAMPYPVDSTTNWPSKATCTFPTFVLLWLSSVTQDLCNEAFSPFRCIMRGRISGSTGKSARKFLKKPYVFFFPCCLYWSPWLLPSLHPLQHLFFPCSHHDLLPWSLVGISLANNAEHFSMWLFI